MTLAADRPARRWFAGVVLTTVTLLAASASFVWWVDPFQQYHLSSKYPPRFYSLHHRYINPGLAKNQPYDTVVSGSSIMESTPNDVVAKACIALFSDLFPMTTGEIVHVDGGVHAVGGTT